MIGATAKRVILAALVAGLAPGNAWAQMRAWDPERYLEVVQEGDALCDAALSAPEDDNEAYQSMMFDCLRAKESALEMLRRAVLQNQVGQIEELWEEANRDLFNLTENVIVLYILLDQCIAADTILSRALREPETLPEGGVSHLEGLIPEIGECNDRVVVAEPVFDDDRYGDLLQVAQSWRAQADDRAEDDIEGRSANLYEASQNYGEALGMLREAIMDGILDSADDEEELFLVYNELITVLIEMDLCAGAQRRVRQAIGDAETLDGGDPTEFLARQTEIQDCQARLLASSTRGPVVPEEPPEPEIRQSSNTGVAPYVLWGVAGAAGITALVLELTASGDRDALDQLSQDCRNNPDICDRGELSSLNDSVNRRKIAVGVLVGGAIVTAAIGTILFLVNQGDESPPDQGGTDTVEAGVPYFTYEGLGGSVGFRF